MITKPCDILLEEIQTGILYSKLYDYDSTIKLDKGYELWKFVPKLYDYSLEILHVLHYKNCTKWIPNDVDGNYIKKIEYDKDNDVLILHCVSKSWKRGYKYDYKVDSVFKKDGLEKLYEHKRKG